MHSVGIWPSFAFRGGDGVMKDQRQRGQSTGGGGSVILVNQQRAGSYASGGNVDRAHARPTVFSWIDIDQNMRLSERKRPGRSLIRSSPYPGAFSVIW